MGRLIGIVVTPDIKADIVNFCNRHNCLIAEPHITLVSDSALGDKKGLEQKLQSFCLSQPPFKTIIGGPSVEEGKILYLTVLPGILNSTRERLLRHLKLPADSGLYRPHVSLIRQQPDRTHDFAAILADAKAVFSKPRSMNVDAIAIYTQEHPGAPYTPSAMYPFTGR